MKPSLRRVALSPQRSFSARKDSGKQLINKWHYHPEIELLLIKDSKGSQIIGDRIENFYAGNLLLLGAWLPHTFIHEDKFLTGKSKSCAIVAHFLEDCFGTDFMKLPELAEIKKLLYTARRGLKITGKTSRQTASLMHDLISTDHPTKRLLLLLEILHFIAESKEYTVLSSEGFQSKFSQEDDSRISKIYNYTFHHYADLVKIDDMATMINLSKESFCRYFKQKTGKTYWQFLMEVRIGNACRLLQENQFSVSEIAYSCGYNNLSNFNHQFKKQIRKSPLIYQREYLERL